MSSPKSSIDIRTGDIVAHLRGNQWLVQNGYLPRAHAVIGDPPYYLGEMTRRFGKPDSAPLRYGTDGAFKRMSRGFMGQSWDGFESIWHYQAWVTEWAELLLDYVYPGAVLAMFGGSRTYHRLAAGLEDAGWEVFDSILVYMYGSGFPKGHNISKAMDRAAGAENIVGYQPDRWTQKGGTYNFSTDRPQEEAKITAPATPLAELWDGYNVALKPAYEPIVLARAPRGNRTYAQLAEEFGTAALNIDGCRIGTNENLNGGSYGNTKRTTDQFFLGKKPGGAGEFIQPFGRWPANVALVCDCDGDHRAGCPVRLLDEQSGESVSKARIGERTGKEVGIYSHFEGQSDVLMGHSDSGGASRFFFTAKASTWEREAGLHDRPAQIVNDGRVTSIDNPYQRGDTLRRNIHPTVKPIRVTEWLARLLLPPTLNEPRRLLVPFSGVGSEMIGAMLAGWDHISGIEQGAAYVEIARQRLAWWAQYDSYEQAEAAYKADMSELAQRDAERAHGLEQMPLFASA